MAAFLLCTGVHAPAQAAAEAADRPSPRLVSLAPHITEFVYAAGAGPQLVGVVEYSDFPPAAAELPLVGDAFRLDYEAVRLLDPDLLLAWESGTPRETTDRLRALGYQVVELDAASLAALPEQLRRIGELAGTGEQASRAADAMDAELAGLRARYAGKPSLRVFFQISADPYYSVTGRHVISEAIEWCGGRNVFEDVAGLAPAVTLEAVLRRDPEVILASADDEDDRWKQGWRRWRFIRAVRADALYTIERDYISRSGPRFVEGVRQICAALDRARSALNRPD